jgi:uncharacterized membrane protein (UPF0127 family)
LTTSLVNERTGRTLACALEIARTRAERRRGLLGRDELARGAALMITPCNAIHTVGMRFPIDVAFLDRQRRVRRIVRDLGPWRVAVCLRAADTLECPAGALSSDVLQVGDRLVDG